MPKGVVATGSRGAVAAAHPLAVEAGLDIFRHGGNAVDAAVAAQATLCVVLPNACGLGGDGFALISLPRGRGVKAVNGAGAAPLTVPTDGGPGASVTVPGIVAFWDTLLEHYGRIDLVSALEFARTVAVEGAPVAVSAAEEAEESAGRLRDGGAGGWDLLSLPAGGPWRQPELAEVLRRIIDEGPAGFYEGPLARAIAEAIRAHGGTLGEDDLRSHATVQPPPLSTAWAGGHLAVQPPMSQGVLLAMAARWFEGHGDSVADADLDHLGVEALGAAFEHRDRVVDGRALLDIDLDVDPRASSGRAGARPYLHTAGVATSDVDGMVVSSLVSVFDSFGSAVFVPEGGFVLNNRADCFGAAPNELRPGALPVHTLAPAMLVDAGGAVRAIATPGADGQVQTLLQVLLAMRYRDADLADAIGRPRWRGESGRLAIEEGHPATESLRQLGHRVDVFPAGDDRFGAVVAAGRDNDGVWAIGDHRREVDSGGV
jgi:gamma-glutamyltranspeptidase/glutathione hydrolase